MNILLTGASGMLGSAVIQTTEKMGSSCVSLERQMIWSDSLDKLSEIIARFDLVVHAAANTNVELCETDLRACYRDNFLLSERVANAARDAGVKMLFVSSTGVYGAQKIDPYCEFDIPSPTTHHHRSKLLAEEVVLASSPRNLVVRTGWLFGGRYDNPKNFVARRIEDAKSAIAAGTVIQSNKDQWGVPCFSCDIADRMLFLARRDDRGIFNCVNEGLARRVDYVEAIFKYAGLSVALKSVSGLTLTRKANVSNNEMAENWKMTQYGLPPMPDWRHSLQKYIFDITT